MATGGPSKVSLSVCRIRKRLSGNQGSATIGSGCIIGLKLGDDASNPSRAPKNSAFLITTTQVITKNDLISASTSIVVDCLDGGKLVTFDLGFKYATDFPEPIPGRVPGGTGDALKEVSFIVIPVEKFDDRNWFKRTIVSFLRGTSFEKRSLACSRQSDETLQSAVSRRKILCHVIRNGRSDASYNTEPYCLEFKNSEFALTSPLDHDGADDMKKLKDFHKEEKPKGAPILSAEGEFVGMLAIATSGERKLFPLFLPSLDKDSSDTVTKDAWNAMSVKIPSETIGTADDSEERSSQEGKNKNTANNNQNLTRDPGNCSTSEVQGSGNPADNPGQLENSSGVSDRPVRAEDIFQPESCGRSVSAENADPDPFQSPVVDPGNESCLEEDSNELNDEQELESSDSHQELPIPETALPKPMEESPDCSRDELESITDVDGRILKYNLPRSLSDVQNVFSSSASGQAAQGGPGPITRQNTTPGDLERVSPGSLVKDKIVSKANIMDVLSLHLDRSVCKGKTDVPLAQRWEQLADEFEVPYDVKSRCENFTSPSEGMFEYLCFTRDSLTIGTLKGYLIGLQRKDIVDELDLNSNLSDETTVNDLRENHPETLCTVCLKLDDQRSLKNWMHLGIKLGITGGKLRKFKDRLDSSPTESIFTKIKTLEPTLPITEIQALLKELNLEPIAKELDRIKDGNIQTLLEDCDVLENVAGLLDLEENSWRRFGSFKKIPVSLLDSLRPVPIPSPTKMVMTYIVQNDPNLTMRSFLLTLVKMKRKDVIEELKGFYKAKDIEAILR